jgi:very-short-patch-repair endonuclease
VAALADSQHGTVEYAQLVALGFSASAIARAVSDGLLTALYRGVFAFGHVQMTRQGRWMAAVLAAGPDAALSHTDGLVARGIVRSSAPRIHVTVPRLTGGAHRRRGLVLHRCRLDPEDRDTIDGIPTTTVARALLDFAETTIGSPRRLELAIDEADKQRLFDLDATLDVLERARGRRGANPLRRALEIYVPEPRRTNSWLERQALKLVRDAGLPMPQVNVHVNGYEVDLRWPEAGLIIELDSREHHDTPWAFEEDRLRDAHQVARGHAVMRITHRRLTREPDLVAGLIRERLARAAAQSSSTTASASISTRIPPASPTNTVVRAG